MSAPSGSRARRLDIQGLRGVAVAAVVLYHAGVPGLRGGFVGVDVFYVVSGYLITGLILRELTQSGRVSLGAFYIRRIRRLLPMSFLVLVATCVAGRVFLPPLAFDQLSTDAMATALYVVNYQFALDSINYLGTTEPSPLLHYWSLAVEEQFYLFWPLLLLILFRIFRGKRNFITGALVFGCLLSFGLNLVLMRGHQPWAFFTLPPRAWELAAGGLLAFGVNRWRPVRAFRPYAAMSGVIMISIAAVLYTDNSAFPGTLVLLPVAGALLVLFGGEDERAGLAHSLLASRPLCWVGDRSYSLYLWHWPLLVVPTAYRGEAPLWIRLLLVAAALLLSDISYRLVEERFRHGPLLRTSRRTSSFAATATVVSLVVAFAIGILPRLDAGRPSDVVAGSVANPDYVPSYVPSDLRPTLQSAGQDVSEASRNGCLVDFQTSASPACVLAGDAADPVIVLIGDSHAEHWVPALQDYASRNHFSLELLAKSSCSFADVPVWQTRLKRSFSECDTWRENTLDRITDENPAIIIIAESDTVPLVVDGKIFTNRDEEWLVAWSDGLARTFARLPKAAQTVYLQDTPGFETSVPICLSQALTEPAKCGRAREDALNLDVARIEEDASAASGVEYVETSQWLCPGEVCEVIDGPLLMYRDDSHLTATFARSLGHRFDEIDAG